MARAFARREQTIMWSRRQARAGNSALTTLIAVGTEVSGDIRFGGDLEVQGVVRGNIYAVAQDDQRGLGCVRIVEGGRVEGEVRAPLVIVDGIVDGDIHSEEQVELAARAEVNGNIHYRTIQVVKGAQFNGNLICTDPARLQPALPEAMQRVDAGQADGHPATNGAAVDGSDSPR